MSQSQTAEGQGANPGSTEANVALGEMTRSGRSFSGRERHCAFLNTGPAGGSRFAHVSAISGLDLPDDGRGAALCDWDLDGDVDLLVTNRNAPRLRILRNDSPPENRFLSLRLAGTAPGTNRDAIGARVEVTTAAGSPPLIRTLRAGEGFLTQSSKWLHFGLGQAAAVERVVVRWPGAAGQVESFDGVATDRHYQLVQGAGEPAVWVPPPRGPALEPSDVKMPPPSDQAVLRLPFQLPMLHLPFAGWDGGEQLLRFDGGRPTLVNLWASWCAPCLVELEDFSGREQDLRAEGVEVVALSVDALGEDPSDPAAAPAVIRKLEFPFTSGRATEGTTAVLQQMHDRQMPMHRPLPLPTSFLVDADGHLIAIYKGPASVDTVLADLALSGGTYRERFERSAPLPGRTIDDDRLERARGRVDPLIRFRLATTLEQVGRLEEAVAHYRELLAIRPDYAEAHNNLGAVYARLGNFSEAEAHLRACLDLNHDFADAHHNLGNVARERGWPVEATARYEQAVALAPEHAGFRLSLGNILLSQGDYPAAERAFRRAAALDPTLADAHNNLGLALEHAGRHDEARASYEAAMAIDPENVSATQNLIRLQAAALPE
ncbi:hypothetical protein BH23VER1_BH23VER1_13180 [soil metagenome]